MLISIAQSTNISSLKSHKKRMENYTIFMDWKNQYSENEYTTERNL